MDVCESEQALPKHKAVESPRPPLVPAEKNNAVTPRRSRTMEVSSTYRSPTPATPSGTRRFPSPNITRTTSASFQSLPNRPHSAERRRPSTPSSPRSPSTPVQESSVDDAELRSRRVAGRLPEHLWPSTMRSLNVSFQSDNISINNSKKEKSIASASDRSLRPTSNVAHRPAETPSIRKPTPERKRSPLTGKNACDQSENSKPVDSLHSRLIDQHRWPSRIGGIGKAYSNLLNRSFDLADKTVRTLSTPVPGTGLSSPRRLSQPEEVSKTLQKSSSDSARLLSCIENGRIGTEVKSASDKILLAASAVRSQSLPTTGSCPPSPIKTSILSSSSARGVSPSRPRLSTPSRGVSPTPPTRGSSPTPPTIGVSPTPPSRGVSPTPPTRGVSPTPPSRGVSPTPPTRGFSPTPPTRGVSPTPPTRGVSPTPPTRGVSPAPPTRGVRPTPLTRGVCQTPSTRGVSPTPAREVSPTPPTRGVSPTPPYRRSSRGVSPTPPTRGVSPTPPHRRSSRGVSPTPPTRGVSPTPPYRGVSSSCIRQTDTSSQADSSISVFNFVTDFKNGKKGAAYIEDAHHVRLFYNRYLQWRFANARAETLLYIQKTTVEETLHNVWNTILSLRDSVVRKRINLQQLKLELKLNSILNDQMAYLDGWALLEIDHVDVLSRAVEDLEASTLRLPVTGGSKADVEQLKIAICSAVDVMRAMGSAICSLLTKAEGMNSLISGLAIVVAQEKAMLDECEALLASAAAMQAEENSLRTHLLQFLRMD